MPKSTVEIRLFNQGMMGSVDSRDVPLESAVYSENLNPVSVQGKLSGIEEDELFLTGADGKAYSLLKDGDTAIFYDGSDIRAITGIGSSPVLGSSLSNPGALSFADSVSDGKAAHFGLGTSADPEWFGEIDYGQFGGSAPSGIQAESALLKSTPIRTVTGSSTPATSEDETIWATGRTIHAYVSLVYDGYQEGPLKEVKTYTVTPADPFGFKSLTLDVGVDDGHADWNKRISGVNVYLGESIGSDDTVLTSEPSFIQHIDINDAGWSNSPVSKSNSITIETIGSQDYASRTGVSSAVEHYDIRWGLSTSNSAYHFIGRCQHDDLPEAERMIFRSRPYRFNVFDWVNDFVILPENPVALQYFDGRIFAFTKYRTFEIDAYTLDIGREHSGVGCLSQDSVVVTDKGMFFADENNLYIHDGTAIHPIGNGVLKNDENTKASWLDADHSTYSPICAYDPRLDAFLVSYINGSDSTVSTLSFRSAQLQTIDIPRGRWDHFPSSYTSLSGVVMGATGRPIIGFDGNLYKLFGAATKRDWTITFREFATQEYAKYYHARLYGGDATVEYSEDDAAFQSASTSADGSGVYKAKVNSSSSRLWNRVHTFQLRVSGTSSQEVDSVGVTTRRLIQT